MNVFYPFKFINEITSQRFRCRTFLVSKKTLIATALRCYSTIFIAGGRHRAAPIVVHMHTVTFMSLFQACLFEPNPTFCLNVLNTCPPFDLPRERGPACGTIRTGSNSGCRDENLGFVLPKLRHQMTYLFSHEDNLDKRVFRHISING